MLRLHMTLRPGNIQWRMWRQNSRRQCGHRGRTVHRGSPYYGSFGLHYQYTRMRLRALHTAFLLDTQRRSRTREYMLDGRRRPPSPSRPSRGRSLSVLRSALGHRLHGCISGHPHRVFVRFLLSENTHPLGFAVQVVCNETRHPPSGQSIHTCSHRGSSTPHSQGHILSEGIGGTISHLVPPLWPCKAGRHRIRCQTCIAWDIQMRLPHIRSGRFFGILRFVARARAELRFPLSAFRRNAAVLTSECFASTKECQRPGSRS